MAAVATGRSWRDFFEKNVQVPAAFDREHAAHDISTPICIGLTSIEGITPNVSHKNCRRLRCECRAWACLCFCAKLENCSNNLNENNLRKKTLLKYETCVNLPLMWSYTGQWFRIRQWDEANGWERGQSGSYLFTSMIFRYKTPSKLTFTFWRVVAYKGKVWNGRIVRNRQIKDSVAGVTWVCTGTGGLYVGSPVSSVGRAFAL